MMSVERPLSIAVIAGMSLAAIVVATAMYFAGVYDGKETMRIEAVKHGVARWVACSPVDGNRPATEFRWMGDN
jgi:hypothetical protein